MNAVLPIWRSLLYVPVTSPKFIDGAAGRGADAIIIDLEDSVAPTLKESARGEVEGAIAKVGRGGADVLVRVNRPWRLLIRDLEAAVIPGLFGLVLTKVETFQHLAAVSEVVSELEAERGIPPGKIKFHALVETAEGLIRLAEIARHPRLVAMSVGTDDLAESLGMAPDVENLFNPKQMGIIAARAAGILPIGFLGSQSDFKDIEGFRRALKRSRRMGFTGVTCVHPSQVPVANEEYSPNPQDVAQAQLLLAAWDAAIVRDTGAFMFQGRMVDKPVADAARSLVRAHEAIRKRMRGNSDE